MKGGGTSELVRLILSYTDNGMLSHSPDGLWGSVSVYVYAGEQESEVFQKVTDSQLHSGWASNDRLCCPPSSCLFHVYSPTLELMSSIYLIKKLSLLRSYQLISAEAQKPR